MSVSYISESSAFQYAIDNCPKLKLLDDLFQCTARRQINEYFGLFTLENYPDLLGCNTGCGIVWYISNGSKVIPIVPPGFKRAVCDAGIEIPSAIVNLIDLDKKATQDALSSLYRGLDSLIAEIDIKKEKRLKQIENIKYGVKVFSIMLIGFIAGGIIF